MAELFLLFIFLQIKHWYIDFINQSNEEVASKGIYGDRLGIDHSAKHGIGTMFCIVAAIGTPYIAFAAILGFLDFILHYHIDWAKMNWGNRDIKTKQFWAHLGLDQMLHQLTYIGIAYIIII